MLCNLETNHHQNCSRTRILNHSSTSVIYRYSFEWTSILCISEAFCSVGALFKLSPCFSPSSTTSEDLAVTLPLDAMTYGFADSVECTPGRVGLIQRNKCAQRYALGDNGVYCLSVWTPLLMTNQCFYKGIHFYQGPSNAYRLPVKREL
jgi:hypothetical protein